MGFEEIFFPGGNGGGGTPDPIPNSEVKPSSADGTAWATLWESRTLPGFFYACERRKEQHMDHGICHFDMPAEDPEALAEFYQKLFGWTITRDEKMDYWMINTGEGQLGGGIYKRDQSDQHLLNYVLVELIEEYTNKAKELGAQVVVEPSDIPNTGKFSVIVDPSDNPIGLFEPLKKE